MQILGEINSHLLPSMAISLPILLLYILGRFIMKKEITVISCVCMYILFVYIIAVLFITTNMTLFIYGLPKHFTQPNLIPVVETAKDIAGDGIAAIAPLIYNIALLIPFGFLLPLTFTYRWNCGTIFFVSFIFVFLIETLEYFSGRYFDVDDLLLNCIGSLIGFYLFRLVHFVYKRYFKNSPQ